MPLACTKSDIHFTSRSEAAFRFPPTESRPPSSLYTRHQTRLQEKHIRPHSPQHGARTGPASPTPTKQTSLRRKFTPRAQKSRHFIKDGHMTQQTQLPPSELGEHSVLSMEGPKSKPAFAGPSHAQQPLAGDLFSSTGPGGQP